MTLRGITHLFLKRALAAGLAALAGMAASTSAATFRVSKDPTLAPFATIQSAIDKAGKGDIVEILDAAVYQEQVTIDSNKHGLILRSSNPTALKKPTIRWNDLANQGPKTCQEALTPGKITFDQNGALRLLRARNVVIDGIGVDAVEAKPFTWDAVWGNGVDCTSGQRFPLFHGNGGIALFIAGNITVRNCDISNAFFGISVKDRNEGGVFANVNPADLEKSNVVPLSGFGKTGNHMFEKNRVHHNVWGFYFESSWDLGSTARYNLIYENHHASTASATAVKGLGTDGQHHPGGGFLFKDVMLSPLAIYNNTFWKNYLLFAGGYRPGAQHLVFNNIYGKPYEYYSSVAAVFTNPFHTLDPHLINRMKHCIYSAQLQAPKLESRNIQDQLQDPATNLSVRKDSAVTFYQSTQIMNGMANVVQENFTVNLTLELSTGPVVRPQTIQGANLPGGLIAGTTATQAFPAAANVRWYEIEFKSTDPASPDFLVPDWDNEVVKKYIMNGGWPAAGIYNSDGKVADLGAIPSTSRHADDVVIRPLSPVIITGTTATLNFDLTSVAGSLLAPKIKYIKLVRSIPVLLTGFGGTAQLVVPPPVDVTPSSTSLKMGGNTITVTGFTAFAASENYAFFELIAEGTGANGQTATTSVGFLPYRKLDYKFLVEVLNADGQKVTQVKAGQAVKLKITPQTVGGAPFDNKILPVEVSLNSGADLMTTGTPPVPLTIPAGVTGPSAYDVMFSKVPAGGVEYVTVAGIWKSGAQTLAFYGVSEGVKILAGDPEKVVFQDPPSKILTPGAAPVLDPGVLYPVKLEVRDRFDNYVSAPVSVTIKSNQPTIGDIDGAATATTDSLGIATFKAKVTNGEMNQTFELEAAIAGKTPDKADLKVGKPRDKLWILYEDVVAYDPAAELRGTAGERLKVTIRAGVDPNTKLPDRQTDIEITATPGLAVFATPNDPAPSRAFKLVNGEAIVYVTGLMPVDNGGLTVSPATDNTILAVSRAKIYFSFTAVTVVSASFHADNGFAAVDRVEIRVKQNLKLPPDSISLSWPSKGENARTVKAAIAVDPADSSHLSLRLAEPFPAGLSGGVGSGTLFTFDPATPDIPVQATGFTAADSVGPLLDSGKVQERSEPGGDTLFIAFNEKINPAGLNGASLILIKQGGGAPITLGLLSSEALAPGKGYRVALADLGSQAPVAGDSLKINGAGPLTDALGNHAHAANRAVELKLKTVPKPPVLTLRMDQPYQSVRSTVQTLDFLVLSPNPDSSWTPVQGSLPGGRVGECRMLACGEAVRADLSGHLDRTSFTVETDRAIKYSVTIFTNLGEFVNGFEGEITNAQLGLDERNLPVTGGTSLYRRNAKGRYPVKISWNATAHNHAKAGTGAYIAKISVISQAEKPEGGFYSLNQSKAIRFGLLRR